MVSNKTKDEQRVAQMQPSVRVVRLGEEPFLEEARRGRQPSTVVAC